MTLKNNDTIEKIQLYHDNQTYAYIKESSMEGKENFFNGFVDELRDDNILFFDVILEQPIPIRRVDIKAIDPSRSFKVPYSEAIKKYREYLKNKQDEVNHGRGEDTKTTTKRWI